MIIKDISSPVPPPPKQGAILVVVLVVLLLLAAILLQMQLSARGKVSLNFIELEEMRLRAAMTDATYQALQRLADDADLLIDHPEEAWAEGREIKDPTGISIRVDIRDEAARFDLNNLYLKSTPAVRRPPREVVADLLLQCGDFSAADRVDSLIDWIDPDNEGFRESRYYAEMQIGYDPANQLLQTWSELVQVNGFDRTYVRAHRGKRSGAALEEDLLEALTLIPVARTQPVQVNVNTAPRHVLLGILGLDRVDLVDTLLSMRANQPLRNLAALKPLVNEQTMTTIQTYLDVKSSYFTVKARAYQAGVTADLHALVHRKSDGSIEVVQWAM